MMNILRDMNNAREVRLKSLLSMCFLVSGSFLGLFFLLSIYKSRSRRRRRGAHFAIRLEIIYRSHESLPLDGVLWRPPSLSSISRQAGGFTVTAVQCARIDGC